MVQILSQNQFSQIPVQGQLDLLIPSVVSCMVASTQVTDLVAGQAVKLVNDGSPIPKVVSLAADSDVAFGFVVYNLKDASYPANARVEIALLNSIMYMTAGAAIARGAKIEVVSASNKVITNAGTNPVEGFAYDQASNDGDLIRVYILTQSYQSAQNIADIAGLQAALDTLTAEATQSASQTYYEVVSLANVNAGKILVTVPTGKKALVTSVQARAQGTFGGLTSIEVNVGAVVAASLAVANLTNGNALFPGATGYTYGAGLGILGADGDDITISKTGSAGTTATSLTVAVTYRLV